MQIDELKAKVEATRKHLNEDPNKGKPVYISEHGPIGIGLIDALVAVVENQDRRIRELEKGARFA